MKNIDINEIDEVVDKFRHKLNVYKDFNYKNKYFNLIFKRINTKDLANLFNMSIYESDKLSNFVDGIIIVNNNERKIIIKSSLKNSDKRYIILYLICYYIINNFNKTINHCTSNHPIEIYQRDENAEYMTRSLLVPEEDFKEMYNNFNNIEFCSEIFGVNEDIIKLRIAELGINKRNVLKYKFK